MKELNLTLEERNTLVCYILITTDHRKKEAEAWEKLAQEKNDDGTPTFPTAQSNANYYRELDVKLEAIRRKLDA